MISSHTASPRCTHADACIHRGARDRTAPRYRGAPSAEQRHDIVAHKTTIWGYLQLWLNCVAHNMYVRPKFSKTLPRPFRHAAPLPLGEILRLLTVRILSACRASALSAFETKQAPRPIVRTNSNPSAERLIMPLRLGPLLLAAAIALLAAAIFKNIYI
jgi:hypothetical protein